MHRHMVMRLWTWILIRKIWQLCSIVIHSTSKTHHWNCKNTDMTELNTQVKDWMLKTIFEAYLAQIIFFLQALQQIIIFLLDVQNRLFFSKKKSQPLPQISNGPSLIPNTYYKNHISEYHYVTQINLLISKLYISVPPQRGSMSFQVYKLQVRALSALWPSDNSIGVWKILYMEMLRI